MEVHYPYLLCLMAYISLKQWMKMGMYARKNFYYTDKINFLFACIKKSSTFANWKYLLILKYI